VKPRTKSAAATAHVEEEFNLGDRAHSWEVKPRTFYHTRKLPPSVSLEKKVAFLHPTRPGVYVFVWQDMPHMIKRGVNALEYSAPAVKGKRDLTKYDDDDTPRPLNLAMTRDAWESTQEPGVSTLRTSRLTIAHFEKDCFSCMRVYLSMQVVSWSVVTMLREYIASNEHLRALYAPLIELCEKLDRIVDIWNSRAEKNAPIINSSDHELLFEALDILEWFTLWRDDLAFRAEDLDSKFFPNEWWEDLNGLVLGLVCTCRFYLLPDDSRALVQRRGDQDPCEHHFAHLRAKGGSSSAVTAYRACGGTGVAADMRVTQGGSSNNAKAPVDRGMATAPMPKRKRPKGSR